MITNSRSGTSPASSAFAFSARYSWAQFTASSLPTQLSTLVRISSPMDFARPHQSRRTMSRPLSSFSKMRFSQSTTFRAAYFFFFMRIRRPKMASISISSRL